MAQGKTYFPGLQNTLKTRDLADKSQAREIVAAKLGYLPIGLKRGTTTVEEASLMIAEFNRITGLNVQLGEGGQLIYPYESQPGYGTDESVLKIRRERE